MKVTLNQWEKYEQWEGTLTWWWKKMAELRGSVYRFEGQIR